MANVFSKTITIDLTQESVQEAIDVVNRLKENLPKAMESICRRFVKDGVKIAKEKLGELGISADGELYQSIRYEMEDGGKGIGYVIAGHPGDHQSENGKWANVSYAVFVEFGYGTGNYYDTAGKLVATQYRVDEYKARGMKARSGRSVDHPSGKVGYRSVEDYKVMNGSDGTKFFGWKYYDHKENRWRVSYGQNPKPFMYKTLLALMSKAESETGGLFGLYLFGSL